MPIGTAVDIYMTYKFLRLLSQKWEDMEAYKLGIIDEKGKILKKRSSLRSVEEKKAYTLFHRLVWKLKRILEKLPFGRSRLASYGAALWLLKEHCQNQMTNPLLLEDKFYEFLLDNEILNTSDEDRTLNEQFEQMLDSSPNLSAGGYVVIESNESFYLDDDLECIGNVLGCSVFRVTSNNGKEYVVTHADIERV
jgi:hypothetical protein